MDIVQGLSLTEAQHQAASHRTGKALRGVGGIHVDVLLLLVGKAVDHDNRGGDVGQKNKITRRWARRGTRPSAPHDQRTRSADIFGAICPAKGKGAGLVLPKCNTAAMQLHLDEIALAVEPGAHALVMLDQAGWHMTGRLVVPANITLLPLPSKAPELNPTENVGQFMRDNWLSNRVFRSYDDILDHCCDAWNKLTEQPWRIMALGLCQWAHRF